MYSASSRRSPCRFRRGPRPCSALVSTWFPCRRASRISIRRKTSKTLASAPLTRAYTKYTTPGSGIIELKEAICRKFERDNGLVYTTDEVIVNNGAKHSLFLAVAALVNAGDEVIIPTPYWVTYCEQPRIVGGEPVIVETQAANGLKLTADEFRAAITPRTRMLFLCSPSNPSGAVYTREELESLAAVAVEHEVYVLSDEIYEKLIYDGAEHHSIAACSPEAKEFSIVVNGVSKAYSMTGWRIGYTGASEESHRRNEQGAKPRGVAPLVDGAEGRTVEALDGPQESVEEMRQAFDARRRYMVERLNAIEGVECALPSGAF